MSWKQWTPSKAFFKMELLASALFFYFQVVANADNVDYWKLLMILGVQLCLLTKSLFTKEEFNINFWKWFSHSNGLLYCIEQFNKKGSTNNALTHYQIQITIISFQLQLRSGWQLKHARNVEKWIWNHNEPENIMKPQFTLCS